MANVIQSTLIYDANLTSAMTQVKALTAEVGALTTSMNAADAAALRMRANMAAAFAANLGAMGGFRATMTNMTTSAEAFGKRLAQNKLTMREYFAEAYRGITRQDSLMRQFARNQARYMESMAIPMGRTAAGGRPTGMVITPSSIDMRNMQTRMNVANQQFTTFRHLVNSGAQEMINFGKNTQWTGRQLTVGLTMPVLLFGAAFAKTFMNIDKELTRFAKVYGNDIVNTTVDATQKMKESVVDLAETISSKYGIAMKDTIALAADVAATGQEGQALLDTVAQTSRLAVLGEVDRQEAMKATLAIQTAFKQNTTELAESINFLNAIENQTSTTLNDLVEAIPKAGPVIKGLGGSIKDLSVLMVAMKEGGIPAAEAANAIKSGMASLINPTKKASDTAKQFGVDLVGIVNANKGQLMPTLFAVQNALDGLDSFSKSKVIEEIFGKYQFARISALFNNLGKAGSQTQTAMELAGASVTDLASIADRELKAYTESTSVRFMRMVETVKNQLLPVGEALLKTLTPALEGLSKVISAISGFLDKIPEPLKNFMGIIGGFALIAGPALMLVGLFKQLIGNGLKAAMSIATLGARLMGLKPGKLEVLDEQAMAAKLGIDRVTIAFESQETALKGLNIQLQMYLDALRRAQMNNPQMFRPPIGQVRTPIRRQRGGPIPGYGGGDIVPAVLEPGEFVVTKEATAKNKQFLTMINGGQGVGRFANGTPSQSAAGSGQGDPYRLSKLHLLNPQEYNAAVYAELERRGRLDLIAKYGLSPTGKAGIVGFGGFTSGIYSQSQNNMFLGNKLLNVPGYENWMSSGVPFDKQSAIKMKNVVESYIAQRKIFGKNDATRTVSFLDNLIAQENSGGKTIRQITLQGFAANTAAAEKVQFGLSDDWEQKRVKTLTKQLDRLTISAGNNYDLIKSTIAKRSISYSISSLARELGGIAPTGVKHTGTSIARFYPSSMSSSKVKDYLKNPSKKPELFVSNIAKRMGIFGAGALGLLGIGAVVNQITGGSITSALGNFFGLGQNSTGTYTSEPTPTPSPFGSFLPRQQKGGPAQGSPALLEPGEFVVNSGAAAKYRPILDAMNSGQIQGFQEGTPASTQRTHVTPFIQRPASELAALAGVTQSARTYFSMLSAMNPSALVNLYNNLILIMKEETNTRLKNTQMNKQLFIEEMKSKQAWRFVTDHTTLSFQDLAPVIQRLEVALNALQMEVIGDTHVYDIMDNVLLELAASGDKAAKTLQVLGSQYGTYATSGGAREKIGAQIAPSYKAPVANMANAPYHSFGTAAPIIIPQARTPAQTQSMQLQDDFNKTTGGKDDSKGIGMRGVGGGLFGISMIASTMTMFGDQTSQATQNLNKFSMALMLASSLMMFMPQKGGALSTGFGRGFSKVKNPANLSSLGMTGGMLPQIGNLAAGPTSALSSAGKLGIMGNLGRFAGMGVGLIANPVGLSVAAGVAVAVGGILLYKKAVDDAAARTAAAFSKPTKTAELFGVELKNVSNIIKGIQPNKLAEGMSNVNAELRDMVRQDYGLLIEKIKTSVTDIGAKDLGMAYTNMIISGMSAEQAKEAISAIAAEAGSAGGDAFNLAVRQGLLAPKTSQEAVKAMVGGLGTSTSGAQAYATFEGLMLLGQTDPKNAADQAERMVEALNSLNNPGGFLNLDTGDRETFFTQFFGAFQDAAPDVKAVIDQLNDPGSNQNLQNLAVQMTLLGINLTEATDASGLFTEKLALGVLSNKNNVIALTDKIKEAKNSISDFVLDAADRKLPKLEKRINELDDALENYRQTRSETRDQMASDFEDSQEETQDEIDGMNKKINKIQEFTNKYIDQIKKRSDKESYFLDQRKRNMSALSALASGDIFGFLSAREEARSSEIQRSYDLEIKKIEERRDSEVTALQKQIDKKQELMDLESKAHQEIMDNFDIQTQRGIESRQELIATKRQEKEDLQNIRTEVENGEISSYKKIHEAFKGKLDDDYKELVKDLMRRTLAELQYRVEVAGEKISQGQVIDQLSSIYSQYLGTGGIGSVLGAQGSVSEGLAGFMEISKIPVFSQALTPKEKEYAMTPEGQGYVEVDRQMNLDNLINDSQGNPLYKISKNFGSAANPDYYKYEYNQQTKEYDRVAAAGGYISGPGTGLSDSIPARLSNGEFVVKASSVDKYGVPMMHAINAGNFNMGGLVTSYNSPKFNVSGRMGYADGGLVGSSNSGNVYNITVNGAGVSDADQLANIIIRKIQVEESRRNSSRSVG